MAARPPDMRDWYSRQGLQVKGGGITLQAGGAIKGGQTDYATGTGFFLGYSGTAYKFSIGSATNYLRWDGSSLTFTGNLSGATGTFTGNLDVSGQADFSGQNSASGMQFAARGNNGLLSNTGGFYGRGHGTAPGIYGSSQGNASGGPGGVQGATDTGVGVIGSATSTGTGVIAVSAAGTALDVQGTMKISSTTVVTNLNADRVDGYHAGNASGNIPVSNGTVNTNLNADLLDGNHASAFATTTSVAKAIEYQTVAATAGALQGYITIETIDGTTGPVKIPYYAI